MPKAPLSRSSGIAAGQPRLADHSADRRMLWLAAMALVVGTGGVCSAWALIHLIALVTNLAWFGRFSGTPAALGDIVAGPMVVVIPVIGSLLIGLMARFGSDKIRGHGIPEAIETILYGESKLSLKVAILKPVSSAISIGSGGPFGAEGPIIMTGGAIGSLFAQCFSLTAAERKTLLVAGAAAGMTGIFGTPVAAVLLAVEVMLFEWKPRSFVPVVCAVLTSLAWRPLLIGSGALFPMAALLSPGPGTLALAALTGLLGGCVAIVLSLGLYRIEDMFHRLPVHWMWWPAIGAVVVGCGGLIEPRVLGAGYGNIQDLMNGGLALKALIVLLIAKAAVWLVALASGTSGGILAPLLIIGGALGAAIGSWLPLGAAVGAMIGMTAVMSGAMRAPLTAAVFTVELTGRLDALPAALAASGAAYAIAVLVLKRSILTEKIARRGRHILQEYSVDPLALAHAEQVMTADPETLPARMLVRDAVIFFEHGARHRSYPVLDEASRPLALVSRADALRWTQTEVGVDVTIGEQLSDASLNVAYPDTPASNVADMMITEDVGRICVVSPHDGSLVGLVARRDLLQPRAQQHRDERVRTTTRQRHI